MEKRHVIYLLGWPGVGKLTIAKEIQKHDDSFAIMHNHQTNDCIFPFIESGQQFEEACMNAVGIIRSTIFDFIINHGRKDQSIIFTNVLVDNYNDSEYETFKKIEKFAEDIEATFIPVRLMCETDEIKKRMVSKDRELFHKTMRPEVIDEFISENYSVLTINHKNELTLDVTKLKPSEVKDVIFKHCETISSTLDAK